MKKTPWLVTLMAGLVAGAALVVACSDDSPGDADAAVCDCPAAEPPLAGRIIFSRGSNPIAAASTAIASADCPIGAVVLGGACEVMDADANVLVMESRFTRIGGGEGYQCRWSALNATAANTGTAEVICLVPAQ